MLRGRQRHPRDGARWLTDALVQSLPCLLDVTQIPLVGEVVFVRLRDM